ncbi:Mor transcription activator family protein [Vibrio mytili]|uniref:Mor transcription activator family protein n=1 Tax=Vibrio mytili TaxID=50718 RepID=UPI002F41EA91
MQLTDEQRKHAISLLPKRTQTMLHAIEREIELNKENPDAFQIVLGLSKTLGGSNYNYFSMGRTVERYLRSFSLVKDHQEGMSTRQLAKKYGLSVNSVFIELREARQSKDK